MKNMRIKVENNLDEIVGELERLGYREITAKHNGVMSFVYVWDRGYFYPLIMDMPFGDLTTLAELKEM